MAVFIDLESVYFLRKITSNKVGNHVTMVSKVNKEQKIADNIRNFLLKHGIGIEDVNFIIDKYYDNNDKNVLQAKKVAISVLQDNDKLIELNSLNFLGGILRDSFGFEFCEENFESFSRIFFNSLAYLLGTVTFFISTYFVIGYIIEGESNATLNFEINSIIALILFVILSIILATLEGTQISIVILRTKELSLLKSKYSRSKRIHRRTFLEEDTQRYLAGRQLFVIAIVFMIAQITSFPDVETLPFSNIHVREILNPFFDLFLLKFGLLGALLVLWFAQLAPQFISNKNPQLFLNIPGMNIIVELCMRIKG